MENSTYTSTILTTGPGHWESLIQLVGATQNQVADFHPYAKAGLVGGTTKATEKAVHILEVYRLSAIGSLDEFLRNLASKFRLPTVIIEL